MFLKWEPKWGPKWGPKITKKTTLKHPDNYKKGTKNA